MCQLPEEKPEDLLCGICRRKAPRPLTIEEKGKDDNAWKDSDFRFCHTGWPLTFRGDWCGEFEAKKIKPSPGVHA